MNITTKPKYKFHMSAANKAHQTRKQAVLTADEARKVLNYNEVTGEFHCKVRMGRMMPGARAGRTNKDGHRTITLFRERYYEHRLAVLIMTGAWPVGLVEHANVDPGFNAYTNLRPATQSQNMANTKVRKHNSTGYMGVIKLPASKRTSEHPYRAEIQHEGNRVAVSGLECPVQAAFAYKTMADMLFGEFARVA